VKASQSDFTEAMEEALLVAQLLSEVLLKKLEVGVWKIAH
jgi:hypothetical protein